MLHSFGKLFDHLFPPSEEVVMVRRLTEDDLKRHYAPRHIGSIQALLPYHEPEVRALIKAAKFFRNTHAMALLGAMLDRWLGDQSQPYLILPVPLSRKRLRERGHNQVRSVLARASLAQHKHRINDTLLVRHTDTVPQTSLKKDERATNVTGAFSITSDTPLSDTYVLLLDDVMTTGATLRAAAAALQPLRPASITKLALAH